MRSRQVGRLDWLAGGCVTSTILPRYRRPCKHKPPEFVWVSTVEHSVCIAGSSGIETRRFESVTNECTALAGAGHVAHVVRPLQLLTSLVSCEDTRPRPESRQSELTWKHFGASTALRLYFAVLWLNMACIGLNAPRSRRLRCSLINFGADNLTQKSNATLLYFFFASSTACEDFPTRAKKSDVSNTLALSLGLHPTTLRSRVAHGH